MDTNTPVTVIINVEKYTELAINSNMEYTFYINGMEYKKLPLDANVREPEINKSTPYKDMCNTLKYEPEKFFENNLGISVIAESVKKIGKQKFEIFFPSGTGILNGGHTQQAILDSQDEYDISKAIVKVNIRAKEYSLERVAEIAAAQNSSSPVKEYSLAEKKGYFAKLKRYMTDDNEKHIIWYEGRAVPNNKGLDARDLIALINLFNIKEYMSRYSTSRIQPNKSATGKTALFKQWEKNQSTYECIYPLVNDIIELYEYIIINYSKSTGITKLGIIQDQKNKSKKQLIFSGKINEYNIPKQFLMPMLAAFRANIYYDENKRKVGWYDNNKKLFDNLKKELCKRLMYTYKTTYHNEINRASKDSNLWEILYGVVNDSVSITNGVYKEYEI